MLLRVTLIQVYNFAVPKTPEGYDYAPPKGYKADKNPTFPDVYDDPLIKDSPDGYRC